MVPSGFIPWYNRAPRLFPAKEWLERRYGFRLPPLCCATPRPPIDAWAPRLPGQALAGLFKRAYHHSAIV